MANKIVGSIWQTFTKLTKPNKKNYIKNKLEKEYKFTKDQIKEVFLLWNKDYKWLEDAIKDVEDINSWLLEYTELWQETWTVLYETLISRKK